MILLSSIFGFLATAAQPGAAPSLSFDGKEPIELAAEVCEAYEQEDRMVCSGGVRVTQGETILSADKMTIHGASSGEGFERIEGDGNVRYASGPNAMSGNYALYDAASTTLTVTGNVVVVQGEQIMVGGQLVYNTVTRALTFTPGPEGRVRGLFQTAARTN